MIDRSQTENPLTTHAEWGAGEPRLLISRHGEDRFVYDITLDEFTLGSAAGNAVILEGTEPVHATIVHDDRDEYVLTMHGPGLMNAAREPDASGGRTEVLRTGARFTMGDWMLVFHRAEYADHGRPYGGREGGEFSDQPPQPERPEYAKEHRGLHREVPEQDADNEYSTGDGSGMEVKDG